MYIIVWPCVIIFLQHSISIYVYNIIIERLAFLQDDVEGDDMPLLTDVGETSIRNPLG